MFDLLNRAEVEATIGTAVASAAWLWRRDGQLALEMRADFMREWDCSPYEWNEICDRMIDYAIRKGEGPAPHASFEAVRI